MEFKEGSNTGQNNKYIETTLGERSQNIHKADQVTIINGDVRSSRIAATFSRLREEIRNGVTQDTIEELKFYETKLGGGISVEQKLADGGFRPSLIDEAVRLKLFYAKRMELYKNYPAAQAITIDLYARIKNEFNTSIFPLIEDGEPLRTVMQQIRENIVKPIMQLINDNGAEDEYLHYTEDHIYGMIYYLTGMCHLNWKDYDNV